MSRYQKRNGEGQRRKALLPSEIKVLADHIREEDEKERRARWVSIIDFYHFAVAAGLRRSEIVHLNRRAPIPRGRSRDDELRGAE